MEYNNEMRIVVFPNDKGGNEKRPDYRGTLQIAGVKYKVSLWNKQGGRGDYLAGQVELDKGASEPRKESKITSADLPHGTRPARPIQDDVGF